MSASNGSAVPQEATEITDKGKGKSVDPVTSHDAMEDSEESDEESGVEDVGQPAKFTCECATKTELTNRFHRSQNVSAEHHEPLHLPHLSL